MAIEPTMAQVIQTLAPQLPGRRVLCLGYPDILGIGEPPTDPELQSIAKWHHWKQSVIPADQFFSGLNLEPEYWDIVKARGPERIVDLNTLADDLSEAHWDYLDKFALVIDPGTSEHIWNIGCLFSGLTALVMEGGYIVHANPLGMGNHGFYSIHPTAYQDFYGANGFKVEMMAELSGPLDNRTIRAVPATQRFAMSQESVMLVVVKKERELPFAWPVQTKYRNNPMLKATLPVERRGDPDPGKCHHVNYSLNGYGYRCDDCGKLFDLDGPK